MQSSTKISLRGISISIIVLTMLILVIGSYRYDNGQFYAMKLVLQLTLPGKDLTVLSGKKVLLVPPPITDLTNSSASDVESFVLQNPCTKPTKKQQDFSARRLVKCTKEPEPLMLIYENGGQLGNQMCSYATLFAISQYNSRKAWMSPSMSNYISKYFNVSLDTIEQNKQFKSIKWEQINLGGNIPNSIKQINNSAPYIKFKGTAQVRQYFDDFRPFIRKEFQFYDHIIQSTKSTLLKIKREYFKDSDSATIVGIHVRRGDYLEAARVVKFNMPTIEFYTGAMKYFADKYENVIFAVASNDLPWCEENLLPIRSKMGFRIHILQSVSKEDGGLDMAVLTHCDHVIYGLGTFGFWTGYLNPGEVIFCSDCITPKTGWLRKKTIYNGDYGNMVLPSWVGYSINGTESNELAKTTNLLD